MSENIGQVLQKIGQTGYDFFGTGIVETGAEQIGRTIGKVAIPIPIVGGMIGKKAGEKFVNNAQYASGLIGEVGGMMTGEKNIQDVLSYIPNQAAKDWWNSELMQVVTGRMSVPDAIVNGLVDYSGIKLFSDKTHAWKDKDGNYHKEWQPGATMVVGKWERPTNVLPTPDLSSNKGILGVHQGEIFYKGFDDARWAQINKK